MKILHVAIPCRRVENADLFYGRVLGLIRSEPRSVRRELTFTLFGLDQTEPVAFLEIDNCILMFDCDDENVFSGAVVMGETYGFFGVRVGANWLEAAGRLESQGFRQASDLERFTIPGENFSTSIYLYPDEALDMSSSKVKDYSVCVRYGHTL